MCRLVELGPNGATLQIDQRGTEELFKEVYAATAEERAETKVRTNRSKQPVPPLRQETQTTTDRKGKSKTRTVYFYPVVVPKGGYLLDRDPTASGTSGLWVKLWRDMVWSILRGVPTTREPFEARAAGLETHDAADAFRALSGEHEAPVELASTYFLGAMARTADNVPVRDRSRFQFLLHFWSYAAQVYVPQSIEIDEAGQARSRIGTDYAIAVPDVANLEVFCEELNELLRHRGTKAAAYRPAEALIDIPAESALIVARQLRERVERAEANPRTEDVVLGFDVFHVFKDGNNVRVADVARVEPTVSMTDAYLQLRGSLWNPHFRRSRLLNLIQRRQPFAGFNRLLATLPYEQTIGAESFCHDARVSLRHEGDGMSEAESTGRELEHLVYQVARNYVFQRLRTKTGLEWDKVKDHPQQREDYGKAKEKIAKDAFLAVRSRSGADFVTYFAGTLCSVPQHLKPDEFATLALALQGQPDQLKTLTLLALSANA